MALFQYPPTPAAAGGSTEAKQDVIIAAIDLTVIDFMDVPLLEAASTNIPASASAPLTVVASLAADVHEIHFQDTTGSYIGIYSDPAGSPVLEAIINPGSDSLVRVKIPSGTVIGIRHMKNTIVDAGDLVLQFLG